MSPGDFDFELPEDLIALRPAKPRSASRLLVARPTETHDSQVADLADWLSPGDLLVFNDTRVIPARLTGERRRQTPDGPGIAKIEATLIRRDSDACWQALVRPAKRLAPGDRIHFGDNLSAEILQPAEGGQVALHFDRAGPDLDTAIAKAGVMPLPPYIAQRRAADAQDRVDYQTVFAAKDGAVAAPTGSLHFDTALLARLQDRGVHSTTLTLHVGAGTFLPVKTDRIADHRMHAEWGEITAEAATAINETRAAGHRIIPVGTTALRLLEAAATPDGTVLPFQGETDLFILPGHRFSAASGLMTNFHLPRSTLFMLVSALMGTERMRAVYTHAIAARYRFYSYGDSSLLLPSGL
ncbi:MAG: tRNA preQ1(34) S-adenosylmethionine ribosyltransferase-isomerase QueA [Pseudomonadota bacterium]